MTELFTIKCSLPRWHSRIVELGTLPNLWSAHESEILLCLARRLQRRSAHPRRLFACRTGSDVAGHYPDLQDVEKRTRVKFVTSVRFELSGRQSFHVFELVAGQGRYATLGLVHESYRLGLMRHPLPWALATVGIVLGRWTHRFFGIVRNAQKWSAGYRCSAPVKSGRRDN